MRYGFKAETTETRFRIYENCLVLTLPSYLLPQFQVLALQFLPLPVQESEFLIGLQLFLQIIGNALFHKLPQPFSRCLQVHAQGIQPGSGEQKKLLFFVPRPPWGGEPPSRPPSESGRK